MTQHAALGASGAHRWMECPGSIRLSEQVPEQPTSEYALEGSAAHEVAELCLRAGHDPFDLEGDLISLHRDGEDHEIEVTENMASAVSVYVDYVRSIVPKALGTESCPGRWGVEVRFSLEALDPPAPMFGTADAVYWNEVDRTLDVFDYKHGRGVVVEVEENPQLLYYALGAVLDFGVKPDSIQLHVVQPRAEHEDGPIRTWEFGWDRLVAFKEELMAAAEEAAAPDAPVGPTGEHCRFCPAKAICPAQQEQATAVVQQEFATVSEETLPAPTELTQEQLLDVLKVADDVESWFKDIRSYVKAVLEQGAEVPGWKLVEKRATRRWADEEEARAWMEEHGIDPDRRKTRSPYQAEQAAKAIEDVEVPEDLWIKRSSGTNLAPESNPRPAVTPATEAQQIFGTEEGEE